MTERTNLRISLVAPSGTGKSTVAKLMKAAFERAGRSVAVLKLAAPLYELQTKFYRQSGVSLGADQQDQRLLEIIATEMRRISPTALVDNFALRLARLTHDVVINDDLRDDKTDWPWMRQNGFVVVRVQADDSLRNLRLHSRGDLTLVTDSPLTSQIARIKAQYQLNNNGSMEALIGKVDDLVATLLQALPSAANANGSR
jgi:dephospho-CoA kinase